MFSGDRGDAHRGRSNVACNLERLRVSAQLAASRVRIFWNGGKLIDSAKLIGVELS